METIVTYTAVLDVRRDTVFFLARLLWLRRRELGTRRGRRSGGYRQAVLAAYNRIGGSTAYRYLHEGIVWWS